MRDYILMLQMHPMIQKSLTDLELSGILLREAYKLCGEWIDEQIFQETKRLRKTLKEHGIQVNREEYSQEGFVIYYPYVCRGYVDRFAVTRDVLRSEISIRLGKYVTEVGQIFKASR